MEYSLGAGEDKRLLDPFPPLQVKDRESGYPLGRGAFCQRYQRFLITRPKLFSRAEPTSENHVRCPKRNKDDRRQLDHSLTARDYMATYPSSVAYSCTRPAESATCQTRQGRMMACNREDTPRTLALWILGITDTRDTQRDPDVEAQAVHVSPCGFSRPDTIKIRSRSVACPPV